MKNLKDIIIERLHINKDIGSSVQLRDVSNIDINWRLKALYNALTSKEKYELMCNVETHYKAHNNPKRLFKSNTKTYKMLNLYICTILCEWDDAIQLLRDEILNCDEDLRPIYFGVKSDNYNKDEATNILDGFIYKLYIESKEDTIAIPIGKAYFKDSVQPKEDYEKYFEHYFELYNIKY